MKKTNEIFVKHILESIELTEDYVQNLSFKEFLKKPAIQDAVLRRMEVIGEAANNIEKTLRSAHPDIEWSKAIAIRNILIHHYFKVDMEIVWNTIKKNLPDFKIKLIKLIQKN